MSRKKKEKKEQDPVIKTLDVIIVVLFLVMLYVGPEAIFYKSRANRMSFSQDTSMISFELQNGDYASIISAKYINDFNGDTKSAGYHALAEYVEAVSKYKVYDAKGYTDRASEQKAIMDRSRAELNELTVFADKVDGMFERVPIQNK